VNPLRIVGVLLAFGATMANAQTVEEALRGIEPYTGSCKREDEVAKLPLQRELAEPDLSCLLGATELPELLKQPGTLLIDTRNAAQFAEFHIDTALNLPWTRARQDPMFKLRDVVLVGSGKSERQLYVGCAELKQAGLDRVRVLHGGMAAWIAAAKPVVGREPVEGSYHVLSDEEFLEETDFWNNVVVVLPKAAALRTSLMRSDVLASPAPAAIAQWLAQHVRSGGESAVAAVVIATGGATKPAEISKLVKAARPNPVLIYTGSAANYAAFLRQKQFVWAAQARGPAQLPCSIR
jgi:rhodanese-related sulfurtransferase